MKRSVLFLVSMTLLSLVAAGCSADGVSGDASFESPPASTATPLPSATPDPPTPSDEPTVLRPTQPVPDVVALTRADLAQRLDMDPDAIDLVSSESVEWRDASLGCPQPGAMYPQVITPGFLIVLEAEGETYRYHTDTRSHFILCERKAMPRRSPVPITPGGTPSSPTMSRNRPRVFPIATIAGISGQALTATTPIELSREAVMEALQFDLSARTGVPAQGITVVVSRYAEVPVASPCGAVSEKDETGPATGGLTMAVEAVLDVEKSEHRYLVLNGLAYYCGIR